MEEFLFQFNNNLFSLLTPMQFTF